VSGTAEWYADEHHPEVGGAAAEREASRAGVASGPRPALNARPRTRSFHRAPHGLGVAHAFVLEPAWRRREYA
jgi:hypothetical protein